jgi:hypothetical protein
VVLTKLLVELPATHQWEVLVLRQHLPAQLHVGDPLVGANGSTVSVTQAHSDLHTWCIDPGPQVGVNTRPCPAEVGYMATAIWFSVLVDVNMYYSVPGMAAWFPVQGQPHAK